MNLCSGVQGVDFALEHYLFGAVKLVKNADLGKYEYFGHDFGLNARAWKFFIVRW